MPPDFIRLNNFFIFVTKKYFSDSIGTLFNNELSYKAREDGQGKLEEIEPEKDSISLY